MQIAHLLRMPVVVDLQTKLRPVPLSSLTALRMTKVGKALVCSPFCCHASECWHPGFLVFWMLPRGATRLDWHGSNKRVDMSLCSFVHPTLFSKLTSNNFCASTANSKGNSRNTCLQKPFTIIAIAFSGLIPRCWQ
jgi:hypothetical protein